MRWHSSTSQLKDTAATFADCFGGAKAANGAPPETRAQVPQEIVHFNQGDCFRTGLFLARTLRQNWPRRCR